MSRNDIAGKTVRPGSLSGYNYYHSKRASVAKKKAPRTKPKINGSILRWAIVIVVVIVGFYAFKGMGGGDRKLSSAPASIATIEKSASELKQDDHCQGNSIDKLIKVGVEQRTLWACEGGKTVHSSSVITGLRGHAETETPVGTYKIYGKIKDTTLTGSDSRGTWRDPVYYWMPFLDNQYGTYGFHDATWRKNDDFGKISPDSNDASHGCVELPVNTSKWLYDWAEVGTTVSVES